ncbi:hypothetical protein PR048_006415 [Dryococelus australis]|uniref:Transposase n=1 Tax=Dryococelus australis TaxID=614101 RepID=A0ABQ9IC47_9NEOP|nr:hypothetical protein PR048_006415 [Dryococelus australis]
MTRSKVYRREVSRCPSNQPVLELGVGEPMSQEDLEFSHGYSLYTREGGEGQRIVGSHNHIQVIMARGLRSSRKQPIFVDFDKEITVGILNSLIIALHEAGYQVVTCVGGLRRGHPVLRDCSIYSFPDCPHLLKLLRNWLLDTEFKYVLATNYPCFMSNARKPSVRSSSPASEVRLAAELFSHTTAIAIR